MRSDKEEINHLIRQSLDYARDLQREEENKFFPDKEKLIRLGLIQQRLNMALRFNLRGSAYQRFQNRF